MELTHRLRTAAALAVAHLMVAPLAAQSLHYSGPVNYTVGSLPSPFTPSVTVNLDGGDPEFVVDSRPLVPSGGAGGTIYLTSMAIDLVGDGAGNIANFQPGDVVDTMTAPSATTDLIAPGLFAHSITGYDFGTRSPSLSPLGQYYNTSSPQDYYWAFDFVPDGAIGLVSGWMRVTVNPVAVDTANQIISGGQLMLRDYAFYTTGQEPVLIGEIPEPAAATIALPALLAAALRRRNGVRKRPVRP